MDSYLPSFLDGSPGGQVAVVSVAGLMVAAAAFVLLRALTGAQTVKHQAEEAEGPAFDPFTFGSRSDRREANRRRGNPLAVQVVHDDAPPLEARVLDRSVGGLGLVLDREFQPGTRLKVRPVSCAPVTPWVEVRVCSCQAQGREWFVGCAYVKTPPYAVLLQFG